MFKLDIDFHLLENRFTLFDEVYEYKSNGGKAFVLGFILSCVTKYLWYPELSMWIIFLIAFACCILWDIFTLALYKIKVNRVLKGKWYVLKGPEGIEYLHAITEKGDYLLIGKNKQQTEDFVSLRKNDSDLVENCTIKTLTTQQIIELLQTGKYVGAAFIEKDDLVLHTHDD